MDLAERIGRRRTAQPRSGFVLDREVLSPTVHRSEPVGRESTLEALLDAVEPAFSDRLPEPFAVVGPAGSGTSAVITALFAALAAELGDSTRAIGTTTRAGSDRRAIRFVYVDARRTTSAFAFYRAVLSSLSTDSVPTSGVGTDDLRDRLAARLARPDRRAVIAVDHHDEPETIDVARVRELLEAVDESTTVVPVGRRAPTGWEESVVEVPAYRQHELVDVVTERTAAGLAAGTLDHQTVRLLAEWADGNAHDALAAVFGAAFLATEAGAEAIADRHLEAAKADVPGVGVHVDRALALPKSRQRVLVALIQVCDDEGDRRSIRALADDVARSSSLTNGTVKRFLYELADRGLLERVSIDEAVGTEGGSGGRRPSTLEARFPTIAFQALTTAQE
ncbi:Cdc6/Cdc18 family protein [Natronosalvus halobius]|uniref:Cdc6/Cdc18 family protein n=1 Tax=Natronosalvus halobius TaxID=2953746 RepID=UPI00209C736A|nr:AAA family ATPase [Natronosalvus halobius]USZ72137.1 AAA family ATPase [Natronosalvus halobius]